MRIGELAERTGVPARRLRDRLLKLTLTTA
jgi:hypothetical protein